MYHMNDPESYEHNDHLDDGRRIAGVMELFVSFAYPAIGLIFIFVLMLYQNGLNLEAQKCIKRIKPPTSIVQWHMNPQIRQALEGLVNEEKMRKEQMRDDYTQMKYSDSIGKYLESRLKEGKDSICKGANERKMKEKIEQEIKRDHEKRTGVVEPDIDGMFTRQQVTAIAWSPADAVVNHLEYLKTDTTNRKRNPEPTVDVESFYV